jgi:NAD(P)-dependent dehydrogenase (short-subunit alcohol dehydrogenase family)
MPPLAVVTGASSGIGRACAVHLAGLGFHVIAGVRDVGDAPPGMEAVRPRPLPDRAFDALVRRALT